MAKLPPLKLLRREDFPGQDWIDKLLTPLNQFMTATAGALDRKLTFGDNLVAQFKTVQVTQPSPLAIAPTLENGFANFDATTFHGAGYYRKDERVCLEGVVKNTASPASGTTIFTLPGGFLPLKKCVFGVAMGAATAGSQVPGRVDVAPSGAVSWIDGDVGYISLDGVSFRAETAAATTLTSLASLKSDIGKPNAVFAVQAVDSGKRGAPVGVPGWDWDGKDQVLIRSLPSLPAGTYTITFLLLGG